MDREPGRVSVSNAHSTPQKIFGVKMSAEGQSVVHLRLK